MKNNKVKNVLLGLGMGTILFSSALFTGCTGLSESQLEELQDLKEDVGIFMEQMTDVQKENNALQDEYNDLYDRYITNMGDIMREYNELQDEYNDLQKENNALRDEFTNLLEATSLYDDQLFRIITLAENNLMLNVGNCWGNMSLKCELIVTSTSISQVMQYDLFEMSDGTKLLINKSDSDSDGVVDTVDGIIRYDNPSTPTPVAEGEGSLGGEGDEGEDTLGSLTNNYSTMVRNMILSGFLGGVQSSADVLWYKVSEDGYYHIYAMGDVAFSEGDTGLIEYVITPEFKIAQVNIHLYGTTLSAEEDVQAMLFSITYGTLDETGVQADYDRYMDSI